MFNLLAIGTTQVKKRFLKKRKKNQVTKNFLQGDSNPDHQNQLELKVNASIHWTTSVKVAQSSLKEVYITSLW